MLERLARLILRIFFREIVIQGRERLPDGGPVLFAPNHPNSLLDPLFMACRIQHPGEEPPIRVCDYVQLCETAMQWIGQVAEITRKHAEPQPPGEGQK